MATSEFRCKGPFLFLGGSHDGKWISCSQDIVMMPVRHDTQVGEHQAFYDMKGQFSESQKTTIRESLLKFWTCSNAVHAARDELFGDVFEKDGSKQDSDILRVQTAPYFESPHEMGIIIVTAADLIQDRWLKTRFVEKYPADALAEFEILARDQSCEAQ